MADTLKPRREYRNIAVSQILSYRLPLAGITSIAHRISGMLMFVLLPFAIWMFDASISSEASWDGFVSVFSAGTAMLPGWFYRLLALLLLACYVAHLLAGIRHVWMDITHDTSKEQGRVSALMVLLPTALITLLAAAKLFGLY